MAAATACGPPRQAVETAQRRPRRRAGSVVDDMGSRLARFPASQHSNEWPPCCCSVRCRVSQSILERAAAAVSVFQPHESGSTSLNPHHPSSSSPGVTALPPLSCRLAAQSEPLPAPPLACEGARTASLKPTPAPLPCACVDLSTGTFLPLPAATHPNLVREAALMLLMSCG
eukprot:SM000148S01030  [mRNA]  locus=s148:126568:127094:- [translate_table: standard]